ncbi:MAG: NADH:flavin oxidoreductase/NADH oxidase [Rubritepida sp.]|jgi:2,4-dienoyl-CoA reductase-like NADH-dependent reductase (Old Yellow Enzyme family)|nr:NADH:flavin oxidoreductase/NADH oxidase [Rubritepida sp.]MCU0944762.1 NADH:flavin oxidoreductase/NADH oxidase [Rubritepida sp.]
MALLFEPLTLGPITLRNRIGVSPMCQYCAGTDGLPTEWHLVHLVSRALGGAGMVMAEATAVTPEGRITEHDLGLWSEAHVGPHARLTAAIAATGALPAIQLAHAGRKAARLPAWLSGPAAHPWPALAPSALAFGNYETPRAMTEGEIGATLEAFVATAQRAARAGYRLVELHAAHGYLLHSFLSPLSNRRNDAWGGDFEGRTRLLRDIAAASRAALPREVALVVRVSHTDWVAGGWTTEESVELARRLKALGVDAVDVSSGGVDPAQKIPLGPGYQVPGAAAIREGAGLPVFAVGLITEAAHAESILAAGQADLILLARALLRDPYWPLRAAEALGATAALPTPPQYERGWAGAAPLALRAETGLPRPALA